jgi:hypothetical protein
MGAQSSALLSDIFLQYIEDNHITNKNILGYFRYVDDILIIYHHVTTNIDTLLNEFNQIHPNLTYTMELENNQQINFLDVNFQNQGHIRIQYVSQANLHRYHYSL